MIDNCSGQSAHLCKKCNSLVIYTYWARPPPPLGWTSWGDAIATTVSAFVNAASSRMNNDTVLNRMSSMCQFLILPPLTFFAYTGTRQRGDAHAYIALSLRAYDKSCKYGVQVRTACVCWRQADHWIYCMRGQAILTTLQGRFPGRFVAFRILCKPSLLKMVFYIG